MSHRARLQPLADQIKSAGLKGEDPTAVLAKIASAHDLNAEETRRVAEMANREIKLALLKDPSTNKTFKFDLADPFQVTKQAQVAATRRPAASTLNGKLAALGGDPFAAPAPLEPGRLSIYEVGATAATENELALSQLKQAEHALKSAQADMTALLNEAKIAEVREIGDVQKSMDRAVQDAANMIMGGITLPSLYAACYAAVSGTRAATDKDRENVDDIMTLVVSELKKRGIPNHRMGFRYEYDPADIDGLSAEDLVSMCRAVAKCDSCGNLDQRLTKTASRFYEETAILRNLDANQHPYQEAALWMNRRPAVTQHGVPQAFLDDNITSNTPASGIRSFNGDSEFVIGVKDLVGAQDRLGKLHNSQEYFGLKLKEIAEALSDVQEKKEAFLGAAIGALTGPTASAIGQGLNIAGGALQVGSAMSSPKPAKQPIQQPERRSL
jgi:hypothetical protein